MSIDPNLDFELGPVDKNGRVGYYPNYGRLTALRRGAYLQWLATGKIDDYEDQWCLFLFLYGLEYRVLGEIDATAGVDELAALHSEVDGLLVRFSHRASFRRYAQSLLSYIEVVLLCQGREPPPRVSAMPSLFGPPDIRAELDIAVFAKNNDTMTSELALQIVRAHPSIRLRVPARRCRTQFDQLFRERFERRFAGKLTLPTPSSRPFVIRYQPALPSPVLRSIRFERSAFGQADPTTYPPLLGYSIRESYSSSIEVRIDDLHTADYLSGPLPAELQELADECQDALSKYSRYLAGKNVDLDRAFTLLPAELRRDSTSAATRVDLEAVAALLADDEVTAMLEERLGDEESSPQAAGLASEDHVDERAVIGLITVLGQRINWTRAEASQVARAHGFDFWGLAMSRINEYALDVAGAILLEGDEQITVDEEMLEELGHG